MFEHSYDSRVLLIYLAIKYEGDLDKMFIALQTKETDIPYSDAIKAYQSLKCRVVTILDYDYPRKLLQAYRPPLVLFYYGDISLIDKPSMAVVGSRDYNDVGAKATEYIVGGFARGNIVVSGLAKGIDTLAHQCAINNGGRTIAVLGSGIDYCYPSENLKLYEEIKKKHLIISEYPFKAAPDRNHFPLRNRIIAALADVIYVPQINSYSSGTMITLTIGLNAGKPIYIAPHPPGTPTINNRLINEGAGVADTVEQILEEIHWPIK